MCKIGNRMGTVPESKGIMRTTAVEAEKLKLISEGCNLKAVSILITSYKPFFVNQLKFCSFKLIGFLYLYQKEEKHISKDIIGEVFKTHHAIQ